jgi:hypothetical protein
VRDCGKFSERITAMRGRNIAQQEENTSEVEDTPGDESKITLDDRLDWNPSLRIYRGRTIAMLRRYLRYSLETGRVASLLGRQYFRTGVPSYGIGTFEDRVIFVHDMEICLQRLEEFVRQLIARYILQEYDLRATARLLHCNEKTIRRSIPLALDQVSEVLLEVGLMERDDTMNEKSCQEGETDEILASDCEERENKF